MHQTVLSYVVDAILYGLLGQDLVQILPVSRPHRFFDVMSVGIHPAKYSKITKCICKKYIGHVSYMRVSPITGDRIEAEYIGENSRNKDASTNISAKKIHRGRDDPHQIAHCYKKEV